MMTARGKLQRIAVNEIGTLGRNTQGVRIMRLSEDDVLAAVVRVPQEADEEGQATAATNGEVTAADAGSAESTATAPGEPPDRSPEDSQTAPGEDDAGNAGTDAVDE